ncbi:MAG TPA: hypothetical protein VGI45_07780 [Terracidiphilus sp.]|jgi:hypothetical protein
MSIFEHRKPAMSHSHQDTLPRLRETLERLEGAREETPQTKNLKVILAAKIRELESKPA